jgi:hypothetical protein
VTLKDIVPFHLRGAIERKNTRQILTIQSDEFTICRPIIREVSTWLGLKRKALLVHRTSEGKWDVKKVDL